MTIKEFTVDVSKWSRGGKTGPSNSPSSLLNEDGFMCCLGFLGAACGIKEAQMNNLASPEDLDEDERNLMPTALLYDNLSYEVQDNRIYEIVNSMICDALININDNESIDDEARMKYLKENFAEIGIEVKFTNIEEGK